MLCRALTDPQSGLPLAIFARAAILARTSTTQSTFNDVRQGIWKRQPNAFLDLATINLWIAPLVETAGRCKQGMDINAVVLNTT